jgi:hypothetical protein
MGSKRGNENAQMRKEDFDRIQEAEDSSGPGTFARADANTLSSRRIIRRSIGSKPDRSGTSTSTQNEAKITNSLMNFDSKMKSKSIEDKPSNPFSGVNLAASSNPFATVNLTTANNFTFGQSKSTPESNSAVSQSLSFGAHSISATSKSTVPVSTIQTSLFTNSSSTSSSSFRFGKMPDEAKAPPFELGRTTETLSKYSKSLLEVDEAVYSKVLAHTPDNVVDFTETYKHFVQMQRKILVYWKDSNQNKKDASSSENLKLAPLKSEVLQRRTFGAEGSVSGTTSGGLSAAVVPVQDTTAASLISTSSGALSSAATVDDENGGFPVESTALVESREDPDWENLISVNRVGFYRISDPRKPLESSWLSFAFGRLYFQSERRKSSSFRMMMRDDVVGRVVINMKISKDMRISLTVRNKKQTQDQIGQVSFEGVNDADRGYERFTVKAKLDAATTLFGKLEELSKLSS